MDEATRLQQTQLSLTIAQLALNATSWLAQSGRVTSGELQRENFTSWYNTINASIDGADSGKE